MWIALSYRCNVIIEGNFPEAQRAKKNRNRQFYFHTKLRLCFTSFHSHIFLFVLKVFRVREFSF
jgi:hypothetical protein